MQLDGIIFDKDGTLFDFSTSWEAWAKSFLGRIGHGDPMHESRMGAVIGFDRDTGKFRPGAMAVSHTVREIAEALHPHQDLHDLEMLEQVINAEAALAPMAEAVPLVPLLQALRAAGLRLGVATNDAEAPAMTHLGQANVIDLFDFIAGFDSGHGGKPAPGQLLAFARQTGLTPERIAMVGDSAHDLEAGRRAGMHTIAVLTGLASAADLAPLADVVLPDIGHIPAYLGLSR